MLARVRRPRVALACTADPRLSLGVPALPLCLPPSPATFLCVLYDLADGLLQAVGPQHELLARPEYLGPGRAGRAHGAGPCGAGAAATARPIPVLHLLSDGWGRRGQGGRGLRLVVQGLQQGVQLLLEDGALGGNGGRSGGVPPRPDAPSPQGPGPTFLAMTSDSSELSVVFS